MIDTQPDAIRLHARAETLVTCPGCGKTGDCRRIGGGAEASRFRCHAYRFSPYTQNECRFVFVIDDRQLQRFA